MPQLRDPGTLGSVTGIRRMDRFVLQEFRLADGASHAEAARILATAEAYGVPLLTSISDERDVALVRCIPSHVATGGDRIDRADLGALVSRWQGPRIYRPSVAESSLQRPSGYSLAVTESGVNNGDLPVGSACPCAGGAAERDRIALLWIGTPADSFAGLFVLVGRADRIAQAQATDWPLPLSERLGVRIYRGTAPRSGERADVHFGHAVKAARSLIS